MMRMNHETYDKIFVVLKANKSMDFSSFCTFDPITKNYTLEVIRIVAVSPAYSYSLVECGFVEITFKNAILCNNFIHAIYLVECI